MPTDRELHRSLARIYFDRYVMTDAHRIAQAAADHYTPATTDSVGPVTSTTANAEERAAWDAFAAAAVARSEPWQDMADDLGGKPYGDDATHTTAQWAALCADALLAERRRRFPHPG